MNRAGVEREGSEAAVARFYHYKQYRSPSYTNVGHHNNDGASIRVHMTPTTILAGILILLILCTGGMTYLMYVRVRSLREEAERLRSSTEVTDDELKRIESGLNSIDMEV